MTSRRFRTIASIYQSKWILRVLVLVVCLLSMAASAQKKATVSLRAVGTATARPAASTNQPAGCPNQGGIITAISVPVQQPGAQPTALEITIGFPAPPGGYYFTVASEDPTIAAAGDPTQALLPVVFIPEGQTVSNVFLLYGNGVGTTFLDVTNQNFVPSRVPTAVWDVDPGADPNLSKFLDANDPDNTCRDAGSPNLSADPNLLSTCGKTVQGAVSDGVTQLLMRLVAGLPGTACYEIMSQGPPDPGMIPTAMQVTQTQTVASLDYGFSFYQAPKNYGDNSDSRQVQVQFFYTPSENFANTSSFNATLTIVRPPLMLVHGIWSDQGAWPDFWGRKPADSYITYKADYSNSHDASFSVNAPMLHTAMNNGFVDLALQQARKKHYAATQVDAVTHSMGGLLTRLYVGSQQYMRPDNFNMGDIHRIVTLDTPHGGSSFANLLVALHNSNYWPDSAAKVESTVVDLVPATPGPSVLNGAVCDLSENSGGLQPLSGGTSILSQVVTASGGPPGAPDGGLYWMGVDFMMFHNLHSFEAALKKQECIKRPFLNPFKCLEYKFWFPQDIVDAFRFRLANDTVVAQSSQRGGLMGTDYDMLIHFGADKFGVHVAGVTNTQAVATQVFNLLDGPDSGFTSPLPGIPADGTGTPITVPGRGSGKDQMDFAQQCTPGKPMKPNATAQNSLPGKAAKGGLVARNAAADARVQVTSPANAQMFAPSDTVNITVKITPPLMATDIAVDVPGIDNLAGDNYDGSTYQASFIIPDDFAGALTLTPEITDANNIPITGVPVTIVVRQATAPLSLTLAQDYYDLTMPGATARIVVTGNYPNNFSVFLTSSASGTTYTSSNPNVLTVGSEGNVQAQAFGTAVVTVQNSGVKAFASFDVEDPSHPLAPQDLTSSLKITRSGFRVDRNTGYFVQTVQITNAQAVPVIGPMYFAVTGLPGGVTMANSGRTQNIPPAGSPYVTLRTPDGITLQPGESLSLTLQFLDPSRARIDYTPKVFRTLSTP